jgi:UDP-N-acetylmuramate--alanine ligase
MLVFRSLTGLDRVHLIGVGGAGMSGIAEILLQYDLEVSGSDRNPSKTTERLSTLGVQFHEGHAPEHIMGADLVVYSSAVPDSNVELAAARQLGIPNVRRAEMLAELMRLKYGIAIAGTHGKTTTTSLVSAVLTHAGIDPTVIVGGQVRAFGTGARMGESEYLVAEADEFDRSFLRLSPILAVITSIDVDHLDTYEDLDDIRGAFCEFANRVPFFGQVILCLESPNVWSILPKLSERRLLTYGFSPQADLQAVDVRALEEGAWGTRFKVRTREEDLGEVALPLPGRHNVLNALAAVAVGRVLKIPFPKIAEALAEFQGVMRRFDRLGEWNGAHVVDDYAHHPAEVTATLEAARLASQGGRVHAIFQPHLFTRTRDQAEAFGGALLGADRAIVTGIYPSREQPIEGVTGELVATAAKNAGHRSIAYVEDWPDAKALLAEDLHPGDVILTLGAGDIYKLAYELCPREETP